MAKHPAAVPMYATSRHRIEQSPLTNAPAVPAARTGSVDDVADGLLWVDFGDPYGVVACEPSDLIGISAGAVYD